MEETLRWTLTVLLYGILVGIARQLLIARPTWELAKREVRGLIRLIQERMEDTAAKGPLSEAMEFLEEADHTLGSRPSLLWHGGQELAAWRLIHIAERELVGTWKEEEVRARLVRGLAQLGEFPEGRARVWKEKIEEALGISASNRCCEGKEDSPTKPQGSQSESPGAVEGSGSSTLQENGKAKPLLQEFLAELYQIRDSRYAQLVTLHNKAVFLLGLALLLAWGLGLLWTERVWPWWWPDGPDPLFLYLAGLGGGTLSRLTRLVHTQRLPTDYGAYWVSLFLAPALGGLAAISGALVFRVLLEAGVLGQTLKPLLYPPGVYGLGVALGFSERLFQGLVGRLEKRIEEGEGSRTKAKGASDTESPS